MNDDNMKTKGHEGRDDLAEEYRWGDAGQVVLLVIFLIVWIADSFFLNYTNQYVEFVSLYIRLPLGIMILACSGYFARTGLNIVFGKVQETPHVIRKGVFGIVRHPIYLSTTLLYLGLIITTFSLSSVGVWIITIIFYHFIARYEEKLLLKKFGQEYRDYMDEVPMWIPWTK
ncbi:MAG: hypothetical protein DRP45_04925 [Candidatus Zixiibacteriota bacterium]|nr:MAG: hypothetical protein DRP45_04925 [candidate division Zixibacteria bacterium]